MLWFQPLPQIAPMTWSLLSLVPLGLLTGLLAGILGIGGGLVFSPLLLLVGLDPHHALATSTLAIVPTGLGGTLAHLQSRSIPWRAGLAIASGAGFGALVFSQVGFGLAGWQLLSLQAAMYGALAITIGPKPVDADAPEPSPSLPWAGLVGVGSAAGMLGGLLGVGGGLVMVPLMVRLLGLPVRLAIRLSMLGVLTAASAATVTFLQDGRALLPMGLTLGCSAAVAAHWSASRLNRVPEHWLVGILRAITLLLALDSGRRAVALLFEVLHGATALA
jgi:uncharacterized membrane protein YfcA